MVGRKKNKQTETELKSITLQEAVMQTAVDKLTKLFIAGVNEFDITDLFKKGQISPDCKEFTSDQIAFAIESAKKSVRKINERDSDYQKALTIAQFEDIYKIARNDKDVRACADILSKKAKILGIGEETKNEVSARGAIQIIHTYNTLGDRTDATIDLSQFGGDEAKPFPEG